MPRCSTIILKLLSIYVVILKYSSKIQIFLFKMAMKKITTMSYRFLLSAGKSTKKLICKMRHLPELLLSHTIRIDKKGSGMGVFAQTQEVWPNEKFENDDDAVILFCVCVWYGSCYHCLYSGVKPCDTIFFLVWN